MLRDSPFFKRYDLKTLNKFLKDGKPESFEKDEIVFLKDRVGIITYGSVHIISHSKGILTPYTEARHHQGKILGHDSDNGITTNSQNWIINYDHGTEILFFEKEVFEKLWQIQFLKVDRQIIEANIECNKLLHCLSDQSQYQIIYEDMQIRKFKPGELICRMSKRARLNHYYKSFYHDKTDDLMDEINHAKVE